MSRMNNRNKTHTQTRVFVLLRSFVTVSDVLDTGSDHVFPQSALQYPKRAFPSSTSRAHEKIKNTWVLASFYPGNYRTGTDLLQHFGPKKTKRDFLKSNYTTVTLNHE